MPPTMLMDALGAVRRRVKFLSVAFGLGVTLAAAVLVLLLLIFTDYLLNLPPVPRIVLSLAALTAIAYVIGRWVFKPAVARLPLSDVAGRLERAFPQFDDRLRSTVDFAKHNQTYGSDMMQQRVMSEAG